MHQVRDADPCKYCMSMMHVIFMLHVFEMETKNWKQNKAKRNEKSKAKETKNVKLNEAKRS
jgi:hypothetical protein